MKILAIRGRNLASLAGDFEIDFDAPPLRDTGLFAIVGPTGAGKSTILDALCLALFDRTPRLTDRGGALIGLARETDAVRLRAQDVRTLLRKGTSSGYAEVDFVGADRDRYRARWSVRRARERTDGAFQPQSMDLRRIPGGELFGATKTEVLSAIQERLGLSFDQFRRSALLAQGDFATFLRADERDRASLLEQITGSEIYSLISMAAFKRATEESSRLEALARTVADLAVLDDDAREAMLADAKTTQETIDALRAHLGTLDVARAWHDAHAALLLELADAEREQASLEARWNDAASDREELTTLRRLQPLWTPVRAAEDAARARDEALTALGRAREDEAACVDAERRGLASAGDRAEALRVERQRATDLAGDLEQARRLDAEIVASTAQRTAVEARAAASRETAATAASFVQEAIERRDRAMRESTTAGQEVASRSAYAVMAIDWERTKRDLDHRRHLVAEMTTLRKEDLAARLVAAQEAVVLAQARSREADALLVTSSAAVDVAEKACLEADREELRRGRARVAALREDLHALEAALAQHGRASTTVAESRQQAGALRRTAEEAGALAKAAAMEGLLLDARIEEVRRSRDLAVAAVDLAGRRAELREGDPCPLCGSCAHPWSHEPGDRAPLVQELAQRATELGGARSRLLQSEAAERQRSETAAADAAVAAAREQQADLEAASAARACREIIPRLGLSGQTDVREPEDLRAAARRGAAWLTDLEADLGRREERVEQTDAAAGLARSNHRAASERASETRAALVARERDREATERALAETSARVAIAAGALEQLDEALGPALDSIPGSRESFARDPLAFIASCTQAVGDLARWREVLAESLRGTEAETRALEVARVRADAAEGARAIDEAALTQQQSELDRAVGRRAALLGGLSTALFVKALDESLRAAVSADDASRAALESARVARAEASARRGHLESHHAALARAASDLAAARDAVLAAAGVDAGSLGVGMGRGTDWADACEARMESLRLELEQARTVAQERRNRLAAHLSRAPGLDAEEIARSERTATDALRVAEERVFGIRHRLERDDEVRVARADRQVALGEQHRVSHVWRSMADLVGSSDGKKFRVFAQSLTFDALLEQSNRHLGEISARYALMRVPGSDLELQVVDHDMADEVRPVTSLSGGESFLVSLALALGLSTLGNPRARVETLFIDEGFGTLDADTLDVALASLEALQASVRQVGLISHVSGLADRLAARIVVQRQGPGRSRVLVERS